MKKSRRTYNGVHLNKKSNTQDVVEQSLTIQRPPGGCGSASGRGDEPEKSAYGAAQ